MKKFLFSFMLIAGLLTLSGCGQKEDENALVILNYGKYIEPVSYTHLTLPTIA